MEEIFSFDPPPVTPGSTWLGRGIACPRYSYVVLKVEGDLVRYRTESGNEYSMALEEFLERLDPERP